MCVCVALRLRVVRARSCARDGVLGADPDAPQLLAPPGSLARPQPVLVPRAADADDSDEALSDSGSGSESDSGARRPRTPCFRVSLTCAHRRAHTD
jgi:hypothetical protein